MVGEVLGGQKKLTRDVSRGTEKPGVFLHEESLSDGGGRLLAREVGGPLWVSERAESGGDGAGRYERDEEAFFFKSGELTDYLFYLLSVDIACGACQRRGPGFNDYKFFHLESRLLPFI